MIQEQIELDQEWRAMVVSKGWPRLPRDVSWSDK